MASSAEGGGGEGFDVSVREGGGAMAAPPEAGWTRSREGARPILLVLLFRALCQVIIKKKDLHSFFFRCQQIAISFATI